MLEDGSLIFFVLQARHSHCGRDGVFIGQKRLELPLSPPLPGSRGRCSMAWEGAEICSPGCIFYADKYKISGPIFISLAPFMTIVEAFEISVVQYLS